MEQRESREEFWNQECKEDGENRWNWSYWLRDGEICWAWFLDARGIPYLWPCQIVRSWILAQANQCLATRNETRDLGPLFYCLEWTHLDRSDYELEELVTLVQDKINATSATFKQFVASLADGEAEVERPPFVPALLDPLNVSYGHFDAELKASHVDFSDSWPINYLVRKLPPLHANGTPKKDPASEQIYYRPSFIVYPFFSHIWEPRDDVKFNTAMIQAVSAAVSWGCSQRCIKLNGQVQNEHAVPQLVKSYTQYGRARSIRLGAEILACNDLVYLRPDGPVSEGQQIEIEQLRFLEIKDIWICSELMPCQIVSPKIVRYAYKAYINGRIFKAIPAEKGSIDPNFISWVPTDETELVKISAIAGKYYPNYPYIQPRNNVVEFKSYQGAVDLVARLDLHRGLGTHKSSVVSRFKS